MKVVKVQLDTNPDQYLAVQPGCNLKGLLPPNLLLKQSSGMKTILHNSTNNCITLKTGHKLGVGTEMETVVPMDKDLQSNEAIDGGGLISKGKTDSFTDVFDRKN